MDIPCIFSDMRVCVLLFRKASPSFSSVFPALKGVRLLLNSYLFYSLWEHIQPGKLVLSKNFHICTSGHCPISTSGYPTSKESLNVQFSGPKTKLLIFFLSSHKSNHRSKKSVTFDSSKSSWKIKIALPDS